MTKRSFLPADKPKLWILSLIFMMADILVVAPLMFVMNALGWHTLILAKLFGYLVVLGLACFAVFLVRYVMGRYANLEAKPWRDQVW